MATMKAVVCSSRPAHDVQGQTTLRYQENLTVRCSAVPLSRKGDFWGTQVESKSSAIRNVGRRALLVEAAISRDKKELTVEKAKKLLQGCNLVAGIKYKGLTVKQLQDYRKSLPEDATLLVCKNRLLYKAIEGTEWQVLKPAMSGMTAWLFVHTEEIPKALKPYRDMQKELKLEDNDYVGAVFEGKYYAPEEFKRLETLPTRLEVYAQLLGVLNGPAQNLVSTLNAPARDLVMTMQAYVQKLESEQA